MGRLLSGVFTLIATEHVFEHSYAANILGFDDTNLIDLTWYVFAGIIAGCAFTLFHICYPKMEIQDHDCDCLWAGCHISCIFLLRY